MFARDLHVILAAVSILAIRAVTVEGGVRALLLGGHRPRELLPLVYAMLALGAVPVADMIAARRPARTMALSRLGGALLGLAVIARLVATG
jgi:hypothetical protein